MRFGFVGSSYTAQSISVSDQEAINFFAETDEADPDKKNYFGTPGLSVFCTFPDGTPRGKGITANERAFQVAGAKFYEIFSDGTFMDRGDVTDDGKPASLAFNSIQILVVSGKKAYCFTLATNTLIEVTDQLAGEPIVCDGTDTYFVVMFEGSNKFQLSEVLDGTTWPPELVNETSVFPDNLNSLIVNHRELWIFGSRRSQPYQDTGSSNVFDVIGGALIESGSVAPFGPCRVDNSVFWIGQDERGALIAWRSNGYTPQRISTHAVEVWLSQQANIADLTSYSYQDRGHLFWVLYVPGSDCNWVFDVGENMWHKRAAWGNGVYTSHWSWNHVYAFGKHLVGDWNSGNLYEMSFDNLDDNGMNIRRLRRSPTLIKEMEWIRHTQMVVDFQAGNGPQPPLLDGDGNEREPEAMLRWSDDRGFTWSNQHTRGTGLAGHYKKRALWLRLGRSRYRVYELTVTDKVVWVICDAYLKVSA